MHGSRIATLAANAVARWPPRWVSPQLLSVGLAGFVGEEPPATQVITLVPVSPPNGEPINGYQEAPPQGNVNDVVDCTTPSPAAVADYDLLLLAERRQR